MAKDGAADVADVYALQKENQALKAQMEALNDKGFDFIKGQLEVLFKDMSGSGAGGFTPEQFEKIRADNEELKRLILGVAPNKGDSFRAASVGAPMNMSM